MDVAPVVRLREAGVAVGLGSDGAVSNNTLNLWEALRLTALIQKDRTHSAEALPLAEALYLATRGGAEALGLGDQLGQMTPGFLADIVLVDLSGLHHQPLHNPAASLVYNMETADVRTVIVNGRVIMRDRRLLTIDEAEVLRQARETRSRLALRRVEDRIQTYAP
jgi:5-methylthioadenosine/S-adenosylhomocysteine deaminase